MKKKPILLKKIKEEDKKEKQKLKALEEIKKQKEFEHNEEVEIKVIDSVDSNNVKVKEKNKKDKNRKRKGLFYYIYRIFALIINLIISIFDSFQWLFYSIIITFAVYIIFKYYNISVIELFDKVLNIIN